MFMIIWNYFFSDDISSLLKTLVLFNYEEKCSDLQYNLHKFRTEIGALIPVIWDVALLEKEPNISVVCYYLVKVGS